MTEKEEKRGFVVITMYKVGKVNSFVHAYGPKTRAEAMAMRKKLIAQNKEQVDTGLLHVSACRMMDFKVAE